VTKGISVDNSNRETVSAIAGDRREVLAEGVELYLGDCRSILPTLGNVDAVVTDPPYGISVPDKRRGGSVESWDTDTCEDLVQIAVGKAAKAVVFGGNYYSLPPSRGWFVWDKLISDGLNLAHAELAWTNIDIGVRLKRHLWSGPFREGGEERHGHPTQKPLGVMRWCIEQIPSPAKTILDPFMGSGTTGVAAVKLGRKFIGIEIEPKYFDIACRRISEALKQPDMFIEKPKPATQVSFAELWKAPYWNEEGTAPA
jgi:DNA modification methylase